MLYTKKSKLPGAGKGLFTDALIRRGEKVVEYEGEKVTWAECLRRNEKINGLGAYYFYVSDRKCIDAQYTPDALARYANDAAGFSRIPGLRNNARYDVIKGTPYIVASRNIHPGEEIYVSYGRDYWDAMRENGYGPKKKPGTVRKKKHQGR